MGVARDVTVKSSGSLVELSDAKPVTHGLIRSRAAVFSPTK
jgi:hypothetical protein